MGRSVLWVVKGLGPGGAERLLAAAACRQREEDRIECAYVLPWKDHLVGELEAAGVRTRCLSVTRRDRRWSVRLARLVRSGEYDVIHVHSPLPGSIARLAARTMPKARRPGLVTTEHNRWQTHRWPTRVVNRVTSAFDDATIAVTDEVAASMRGAARRRVVVLRHGIDVAGTESARADRDVVRAELGVDGDEVVIGTAANFRPPQHHPTLLAAARLLAAEGVPARIVAVGQGPQEAEIHQLRDELGLSDRVLLTGFRSDAVRVLGACDVFTLASQWEGLPVAVMEALALGLPIVTTAVGGMAEEFHDGDDALLVPPRDPAALAAALRRVVEDDALRQRLADAARRRAPEFDVGRTVAELNATYDRVARRRPPPPVAETPARRPRPSFPELEVRAAVDDDRAEIIALLQRSLGDDGDPRYADLFSWKHDTNRFGRSPMWVAIDDGRIVAFRALMRWEFERGGRVLRAVRAVDTATDPDYQGRGLFRTLTLLGVEEMRSEGVDFVFNTPNSQSRPGYLKMGWREVGRLPAAVHFAGPSGAVAALRSRVPADRWSQPLRVGKPVGEWLDRGGVAGRWPVSTDVREIRTRLDDEFLAWRFDTPLLGYRVVDDGDTAIIVRSRRRGAALELAVVAVFGDQRAADKLAGRVARDADASYAIRLGQAQMSSSSITVPLPGGGPVLTWRAVNDLGEPPLANWALTLGDIELF